MLREGVVRWICDELERFERLRRENVELRMERGHVVALCGGAARPVAGEHSELKNLN